ncbi:MAG: 4'-phosphopantetheinyl transferase superfamily protein [Bacteroidaceae bacterium]|nr:4'-phosphopantetheinyl transferase superfamily protein [Bacteroidaceae bacterium]
MSLFLQKKTDRYQWAIWKIDESEEDLLKLIPFKEEDLQKVHSFRSVRRRLEWLIVRVLLYQMLGKDKDTVIAYEVGGKPYLKDSSLSISISHTKSYVAIILSTDNVTGIDIEQYGQRVWKVRDRFVRTDEYPQPYDGDITWGLLLHWSAKEALFKCLQNAAADYMKIRLQNFIPQNEGSFFVEVCNIKSKQIFPVSYFIHPDFVMTWLTISE